jgi:hypothetical protein
MTKRYLFVSYARADAPTVLSIVEEVSHEFLKRALDVEVWMNIDRRAP